MKSITISGVEYEYIEGDFAFGKKVEVIKYKKGGMNYRVEWMFESMEKMIEGLLLGVLEEATPE